ncbi:MAG: hypothetical protein WA775_05520 [Psychroserpens sp.]|uniref:hypothetical protein n=1 Tax=Psychroserpens sp. TaxID=2020870 RepID=UPI003CA21532
MNRYLLLLFFCAFCSCDYFDKKKVYTKDLLEEELQAFNWKDVDEYPTFTSCDSTSGKIEQKHCFETTLRRILNTNLAKHHIMVTSEIHDTIHLKITINNKGVFFIDSIQSSVMTKSEIPQLDSLLRHSLSNLPKIYPAIKRSQQVTTQFSLPVIIKIE